MKRRSRDEAAAENPAGNGARSHRSPPSGAGASDVAGRIAGLQRAAGNRAVADLIGDGPTVQRQGHAPSLLGGETLHLDPAIEAQMRALEAARSILDPETIRSAIRSAGLDLVPPPWLAAGPEASEEPLVPRGRGPATPHAAGPGDVLDAITEVPAVARAIRRLRTRAVDRVRRDWRSLSTGEKALVIGTSALIAGGALGGAFSDRESRRFLLDQLDGRNVPVPGVDGLSVQFSTKRDNLGVMFTLDLSRFVP